MLVKQQALWSESEVMNVWGSSCKMKLLSGPRRRSYPDAWRFVSSHHPNHNLSLEKPIGPGSPSRAQFRMDYKLSVRPGPGQILRRPSVLGESRTDWMLGNTARIPSFQNLQSLIPPTNFNSKAQSTSPKKIATMTRTPAIAVTRPAQDMRILSQ